MGHRLQKKYGSVYSSIDAEMKRMKAGIINAENEISLLQQTLKNVSEIDTKYGEVLSRTLTEQKRLCGLIDDVIEKQKVIVEENFSQKKEIMQLYILIIAVAITCLVFINIVGLS